MSDYFGNWPGMWFWRTGCILAIIGLITAITTIIFGIIWLINHVSITI